MATINRYAMPLFTLFVGLVLSAQNEVITWTYATSGFISERLDNSPAHRFSFELDHNLIWVEAEVDGVRGQYILDTGAPTLLINDRGTIKEKEPIGFGSGGQVAIQHGRVRSFSFAGIEHGSQPTLNIDLRGMENRTKRDVSGLIGHEQLGKYELLIDYNKQEFSLYPHKENPLHEQETPALSIPFYYLDHLPVIVLYRGNRKLYFAIDTAAGYNILHTNPGRKQFINPQPTGHSMNIKGIDGKEQHRPIVAIDSLNFGERDVPRVQFVSCDLSHLQPEEGRPINGILGTPFLKQYRISINFRKRRLYIWDEAPLLTLPQRR
ncbi:MAG: pepsin/retropepsin-like aspartic protease family protein [Bacteroidota bacterium]